jgi:U4/U6 small nuclear ribonucleoprotein PRP4
LQLGIREQRVFSGHSGRLSAVAWHPTGRHFGTSSFDRTWRLWDAETGAALLSQEGHSREVYAFAFHPDGSLAASGDLGGTGRVWDLRSGKSIFVLDGQSAQMLSLDFSPNGFHLACGSDDSTATIWDLRAQRRAYTLAAHAGLLLRVRFAPTTGEYLATASYDGKVKLWSARDWSPLATLVSGQRDAKVTCVDICRSDESKLVTCGFDRTFKVWGSAE